MPLRATASGRRALFRVSGADTRPPEWTTRPPSRRRRLAYYRILAAELWHAKQASLAAGEDRHGDPLAAVKRPRSGVSDWSGRRYRGGAGPPLSPFGKDSRVRNLLRVRSDSRGVVVSWIPARLPGARRGGKGPRTFAELLVLHAKGGRTGVVRDVIGLPETRLLLAVERAIRRWRLREGPRPVELPSTSRAGATGRAAGRPEPERRVSTRLGRGATDAARFPSAPMLVQRLVGGLFGL